MWYRRTNTGNYSTLAEWETSIDDGATWIAAVALPSIGDVVYANNFVVTLDVDVTSSELTNGAELGVTLGGRYECSNSGADYIIGDIRTYSGSVLINNASKRVVITGDVFTEASSANGAIDGNNPVTIIGNVNGGSGSNYIGIREIPDLIITGYAKGGSYGAGNTSTWGHAVYRCTNFQIGAAMSVAGGTNGGYGVYGGNGVVEVAQKLNAITDGPRATYGAGIEVESINNLVDADTLIYSSSFLSDTPTGVTLTLPTQTGTIQVDYLVSTANYPSEANVKDGVIYGNSNQFEGTLQQVDAAQLASDLLDEIQTSSHVVAQRLRASATDDSVGQIVTATLGG